MTTTNESPAPEFSLTQARHIVRDLFTPKPWIYWLDASLCMFTGHALFPLPVFLPWLLPEPVWLRILLQVISFVVSGLCFYRAMMFIHEIAHQPEKEFRAFRLYWNYFCGVRVLVPAFLYYSHASHHRRKMYGTAYDGEYIPFEHRPRRELLLYFSQPFLAPIIGVLRFYILTPLTWFSPTLRKLVHERASSLVVNLAHLQPPPTPQQFISMRRQEVQCFNNCALATLLLVFVVPQHAWAFLLNGYLMGVFGMFLNHTRALASHRWTGDEHEMSFLSQLLDSANYPTGWINELWAPVGTRYHALHHLFPSLPYHNLPEAHRRLMAELPADSPYRRTVYPSMFGVLWSVLQRSGSKWEPQRAVSGSAETAG